VAGHRQRLDRIEHPRFAAERRAGLLIVEPRVAARHQQHDAFVDPERQRLGDLPRRDAQRRRRLDHRRGALLHLDDRQIGRAVGKIGTDGCVAHDGSPFIAGRAASSV